MIVHGTFEVTLKFEPPYEVADGVSLGKASGEKRFHGPLTATSVVHMLAARTPVETSAGYVAIERLVGTLDGREGSFVLQHHGVSTSSGRALTIVVVPDSGTGALVGLRGRMEIQIENGQHRYELDYTLGE